MNTIEKSYTTRYQILIGLKDKNRHKINKILARTRNKVNLLCYDKRVSFSSSIQRGTYYNRENKLENEISMRIVFLFIKEEDALSIASQLKDYLNQESVLVVKDDVVTYNVKDKTE